MLFMRAIVLIAIALIALTGGLWFYNNPGIVHIQWLDYEIDTSVAFSLVISFIILGFIGLCWNFIKFVITLPWRLKRNWQHNKIEKGYAQLYHIIADLEQGSFDAVTKDSERIGKSLNEPGLALYLQGVAATTSK